MATLKDQGNYESRLLVVSLNMYKCGVMNLNGKQGIYNKIYTCVFVRARANEWVACECMRALAARESGTVKHYGQNKFTLPSFRAAWNTISTSRPCYIHIFSLPPFQACNKQFNPKGTRLLATEATIEFTCPYGKSAGYASLLLKLIITTL